MSANSSKTTIDHDEIRQWAESRGGRPATVKSTEKSGEPGILRIDFPGYSGEGTLEEIAWDDFFAKFEESNLAFVYQEKTADGQPSNFSKLVSRPDDMVQKARPKSESAKGSKAKASSAKGAKAKGGEGELDVEIEVQMDLDKEPGGAEQPTRGKQARARGAGQSDEGEQDIEVEAQIDLDDEESGESGGAERKKSRGKQASAKGAQAKGAGEEDHSSHMTIDHDEIREWVEARGGHPATVTRTEKNGEPGVLRIDFPGFSGEDSLEEISWDDFFAKFEESNLAFVYQQAKASGEPSYFSRLVSRPDDMGGSKAKQGKSKSKKAA
ncbi:lipocalin/fatty-acid binding family protein [Sorangium sp. So ce388]|uniref:lipocalin/fatty-acid binding family protein n=1 Tax=Sorangium sp. So ce388 TaxID=3133309 RepID=UPI003F5BD16E